MYNKSMPNYNYKQDKPIANVTEKEVALILTSIYNAMILEFGHTNEWDIKAKINGKIFTFEVKEDFTCERTGNVGVEFECRGKPSGISVSKADFYIFKIHTPNRILIYLFKTKQLKGMITEGKYFRIVNGGDIGSGSMNYLFKYDTFIKYGKCIWQMC